MSNGFLKPIRGLLGLSVAAMLCCGPALSQVGSAAGAAAGGDAGSGAMQSAAPMTTPMSGEAMLYPGEDFRLESGDLIAVRVFQQPEYQATLRVDLDGNVLLPFIGSVNVRGLTVRAAQALIADRLRTGQYYKDPEVTIQVARHGERFGDHYRRGAWKQFR
jgi:protein involved in polysaccharide export with SLBB domain